MKVKKKETEEYKRIKSEWNKLLILANNIEIIRTHLEIIEKHPSKKMSKTSFQLIRNTYRISVIDLYSFTEYMNESPISFFKYLEANYETFIKIIKASLRVSKKEDRHFQLSAKARKALLSEVTPKNKIKDLNKYDIQQMRKKLVKHLNSMRNARNMEAHIFTEPQITENRISPEELVEKFDHLSKQFNNISVTLFASSFAVIQTMSYDLKKDILKLYELEEVIDE